MKKLVLVCLALALCAAVPATAIEPGTWLVKFGAYNVDPKSDNGSVAGGAIDVEVDDALAPALMFEYFVAQNLGIEVLAGYYSHDIEGNGSEIGSVDHIPPTVSLQYHFNGEGTVSPFVGVGLNYTMFLSEDTSGPIAGADLELDDSVGYALHAGVDFKVNDKWSIGVDARYIDIDSDVSLNGAEIGTVEIDPIVLGVYASIRI